MELWPEELRGKRVGAVVHPASVMPDTLEHVSAVLAAEKEAWRLTALFGPQHGILGNTQDNMIEWDPADTAGECRGVFGAGVAVHSLYGAVRKPSAAMLRDVDVLLVDLQDVGARYYTFVWTMLLCMQAAAEHGLAVVVLDRPNPLGGVAVEGPRLEAGYESFVGLLAGVPVRHGLTIGELARYFCAHDATLRAHGGLRGRLHVLPMAGYARAMDYAATGLPWVLPSPNMPTPDTARVYPGMCLLEALTPSEGRGTTRPFELAGAPWCRPARLKRDLDALRLPGCVWRVAFFEPAFHKYRGRVCGGVQLHVTDPHTFRPLLAGVALVWALRRQAPVCVPSAPWSPDHPDAGTVPFSVLDGAMPDGVFGFKAPPYEYVYDRLPFDILAGSTRLRQQLEAGLDPLTIARSWEADEKAWLEERKPFLLYE